MGVSLGHLTPAATGVVTLVGLVTIAVSSYMITFSHRLFPLCEPWLGLFERRGTPREPFEAKALQDGDYPVILFWLGRFGTAIGLRLKKRGLRVLGIDFNPQAVRRWRDLGLEAELGDATDPEYLAELPLHGADWVVSTVPIQVAGLSHEDARRTLILCRAPQGSAAGSPWPRTARATPRFWLPQGPIWCWNRSRMPPIARSTCCAGPRQKTAPTFPRSRPKGALRDDLQRREQPPPGAHRLDRST